VAALVAVVVILTIAVVPETFGVPSAARGSANRSEATYQTAFNSLAQATPSATPAPTLFIDWTLAPAVQPAEKPNSIPTPKPTAKPRPKPAAPPKFADTVAGAKAYALYRLGRTQYNCINKTFQAESKWNPTAGKVSGAYGIPQAFPGSKMAVFGSNWRTSPITQVKWGIWYVIDRYGSPCQAETFRQLNGWY
jgi:hypothetical protein